jgi:serine/threonine protein kinase
MTGQEKDEPTRIVRRTPTAAKSERTMEEKSGDATRPAVGNPRPTSRLAKYQKLMPKVGSKFIGFHLIAELGRGATGKVFLAQQGDLAGRYVALKVCADVFDESQTLAQLQHTHVVPIYSIHRVKPFLAVCMPYFGSTTLSDVIGEIAGAPTLPQSGDEFVRILGSRQSRFGNGSASPWLEETQTALASADTTVEVRGGRRSSAPAIPKSLSILEKLRKLSYVETVLWVITRLAEGLAHAHERGILHLDLKPANILLTDEGQPMLLDFNLARDTKSPEDKSEPLIGGTLSYMSPEHLRAFRREKVGVDARSDIYSLGLILYELLTGQPAFPSHNGPMKQVVGQMIEDRRGPLPEVRAWNPAVTPAIESLLLHCLQPDPACRYQNCYELIEDLQRHVHNQPLKYAPEPSLAERAGKWLRRHPRLISSSTAIIALETLVIIALLAFASGRRQHTAPHVSDGVSAPPVVSGTASSDLTFAPPAHRPQEIR